MVGFQSEGVAVSIGDEGVIAVIGEQGKLGAGGGLDPPDDETRGTASGSFLMGVYSVSATSAAPSIQYGMGVQSFSGMAAMVFRTLWC